MQRINITLPDDLIRDFNRSIPHGKRSKFIAEAISKNLPKKDLKKELIKSLKTNHKLYEEESKVWDAAIADGLDKW